MAAFLRNCKEAGCRNFKSSLEGFIGPVCDLGGGVFAPYQGDEINYCSFYEPTRVAKRKMDERDKEIQELRRENDRLRDELTKAKLLQFELFKKVPADKIIELMREAPEKWS